MNRISLNGTWECEFPDGTTRIIDVPNAWEKYTDKKDINKKVSLSKEVYLSYNPACSYYIYFGAVSYYCDIYINSQYVCSHEGMWDSFKVDITPYLKDGKNNISLDVIKPGYDEDSPFYLRKVLSGFIPDVLCTFGGIWDDIYIEETNGLTIDYHYVMGKSNGKYSLTLGVISALEQLDLEIDVKIMFKEKIVRTSFYEKSISKGDNELNFNQLLDEDDIQLWSPNKPNMYTYVVDIKSNKDVITFSGTFGFRDMSFDSTKILINNNPTYIRGVLHWGYYDKDFIPNPSVETIQKEINIFKDYGFNAIKHCLYIPRESYLNMCDEQGIMQWVELPLWLPEKSSELNNRMKREYPRLLRQLAGHPSIIFISLGCELDDSVSSETLKELYDLAKDKTDTLVRDNSGSGECYEGHSVDHADFYDYHFYADLHNMEHLMESFTPTWRNKSPWVFGEFCDSDTIRDLNIVRERYGVKELMWESDDVHKNPISKLKPDFFSNEHEARMEKSKIRDNYDEIYKKSINHSLTHRKIVLEMTRAFPEISGYNITTAKDVPICPNGLINDFDEAKFDTDIFRSFNNDIVLSTAYDLTRKWLVGDRISNKERYNFYSGDYYALHVILSNYSTEKIVNPIVEYKIFDESNNVLYHDTYTIEKTFKVGDVLELCYIKQKLKEVKKASNYLLSVNVHCNGKDINNTWPIFVYPKAEKQDSIVGVCDYANIFNTIDNIYNTKHLTVDDEISGIDVLVTSVLSTNILEYAKNGGKVIYIQRGKGVLSSKAVGFWRESLPMLCDHPILKDIKYTHYMDDLRLFSVSCDTSFIFDDFKDYFKKKYKSIIKRYDCREWENTDYMCEFCYGKGKIIASTLRLEGNMGKQPMFLKNNIFAKYLLDKTIQYLINV